MLLRSTTWASSKPAGASLPFVSASFLHVALFLLLTGLILTSNMHWEDEIAVGKGLISSKTSIRAPNLQKKTGSITPFSRSLLQVAGPVAIAQQWRQLTGSASSLQDSISLCALLFFSYNEHSEGEQSPSPQTWKQALRLKIYELQQLLCLILKSHLVLVCIERQGQIQLCLQIMRRVWLLRGNNIAVVLGDRRRFS